MHGGCLPMPYPPAVACAPNSQYAALIQRAYASIGSELTAVMQYTYGSFILKPCFPEAAETLMAISICEMHHLELLAELLISLGEIPKFCAFGPSQNRCWWRADPRVLSYAASLEKQLTVNIKGEKEAIEFYNLCICRIDDENIKKLLQRIIMDEEHHLDLLNSLYERFCR
jgi:bacterioferritin